MKNLIILKSLSVFLLLLYFNALSANDLSVEVHYGFCAAQGSGQAIVVVEGGQTPYTYVWSDPALDGQDVYDLESGVYSVTVTDATNCVVTEDFQITGFSNVSFDMYVVKVRCAGQADGQIVIDDANRSNLIFSLDGINFSEEKIFENLEAGDYTVYAMEPNGCISEREIEVHEPAPLIVDLGPDVTIELGESIELEPVFNASLFNIQSIDWDIPNALANCLNLSCSSIYETPFDTMTYRVTIEDTRGCIAEDEITVNVIENREIYIPNAFTPNGDGFNDVFTIYTGRSRKVLLIKEFVIRDNFGTIVYRANDFPPQNNSSFGWDGSFSGKEYGNNVFCYKVSVEYIDGVVKDFYGDINLIL